MKSQPSALRDFTVDRRVLMLSAVAVVIGTGAAVLAVLFLLAIAFCTNLFYYHRFSTALVGPAGSPLPHAVMLFVPIIGGLLVGLIARFGSERIRGHGMPEAIEAILLRGARVNPALAVLKPASAAIAIGSGGPFGAEGPIIMTGGAFGSLIAQWLKLSDSERTTLLVAGAAGGMAAIFAAPLAAIILGVELFLFEWRPRSLIPVAVSSIVAGSVRIGWLGAGPLFPASIAGSTHLTDTFILAALLGTIVGFFAAGLSRLLYFCEDLFEHNLGRLGVHWMWWPAIGGIGIGLGGLIFPRALGVGYDNIAELLRGGAPWAFLLGVLVVKSLMWVFSLGSGTSGGILAPLLMIGAAAGEFLARLAHLPPTDQALGAMLGMGAMLSGAIGVPLTAIVFSLELTHAFPALLPLTLACVSAYTVTSLLMPRSILTERLSRRGYHLTREYGVDPLELVIVADVMTPLTELAEPLLADLADTNACIFADQPCRSAAEQMATAGSTNLPVHDRTTDQLVGVVTVQELLTARRRSMLRNSERNAVFTRPHFHLRRRTVLVHDAEPEPQPEPDEVAR